MEETDQDGWRGQALVIVRSAKIWAGFLLVAAVVLFVIKPAPYFYLLTMAFLGASYSVFLAMVWRRRSTVLFFVLVVYVSATATIAERLFRVDSQYQDVQGVLLAFACTGAYMTLARGRFLRDLAAFNSETNQTEQAGDGDA
ncbi:hypothetical protein ACFQY0_20825 [Haloferula chungangensis]|uniref:Uncharacterized protein n=1 Tax=Haloferula chungangensis TaxID=1048331 RepID=A0ABW2LDQ3_9BACT